MEHRRRIALTWIVGGALFLLCGLLGYLQYRWIGEASRAERDRLRSGLQASLNRLSADFNAEIAAAVRAVLPDPGAAESHPQMLRRIGLASTDDGGATLRLLNPATGSFEPAEWPPGWEGIRERLELRFPPGPPPPVNSATVFEVPLFAGGRRPGPPRDWLVAELNLEIVRGTILPELVQRHLGSDSDYEVEVVARTNPPAVIYRSDPDAAGIGERADAAADMLEVRFDQMARRRSGPRMGEGPGRRPGPGPARWRIAARHRAGSLDAAVARTRRRNLAVTVGVLLLMAGSLAALIWSTRRAQRLAQMQMEFVAGVSHELRTPLTVIRTAAYNLRGSVAGNRAQVEQYGVLIEKESGRLKNLVEQVLRFAGAQAGRVIQKPEPVSVETVIDEAIAGRAVEKRVDAALPPILGDRTALQHALENLVGNAAKHGGGWIGIFASAAADNGRAMVEIRVADYGPGIPDDEQARIFDPFFRGRRALRDQVHGSGLGLNLVKRIVEAHGGSIRVKSQPGSGTEFIVRLPAAPEGTPA